MKVADTDVLIDFLRGRHPVAELVAEELRHGLATTAVNAFELLAGTRTASHRELVERLLAGLEILPLDTDSARTAARVRLSLDSEGQSIGMGDSLIAGICLHHRASLMTRNKSHFSRISALSLYTPD